MKTHEFYESGNNPLFYFLFLKSRDRYLRELGLVFFDEKVCDSGSCVHDSYRNESLIMTHKI